MVRVCQYCGIDLSSYKNGGLQNHIRWCKENPKRKIQLEEQKRKEAARLLKQNKPRVLSKETRKKISEGRKRYLAENKDMHVWKRKTKFISKPCNDLKDNLRSHGFEFVEEYSPLLPSRFFSIDIAFPELKIGIEVNGNQHYNNDGTLGSYYNKRHKLIEDAGWVLVEIPYSLVYHDSIIEKISDVIKERKTFDESLLNKWQQEYNDKQLKKELLYQEKQHKAELKRRKKEALINKVLSSDIDFKKFGWVSKVAKILNITPQKTGAWVKRNIPDLYAQSFRRK